MSIKKYFAIFLGKLGTQKMELDKDLLILGCVSCGFAVLLLNYLLFKCLKSRNQKPKMEKDFLKGPIKELPKNTNKLEIEKHKHGIIKNVTKIPKTTMELLQQQPISKIDVESNIEKPNTKCSEIPNYYHLVFLTNHLQQNSDDGPIPEKSSPGRDLALNVEPGPGPSL